MTIKLKNHDWKKYPIITAGMMAGKKYYCSWCGKEIKGFKDRVSAKEFKISGCCQQCQDSMFGEE